MNMYWVYEIPNWLFASGAVVVFVAIGLGGLYITRNSVGRLHSGQSHNDIVSYFFAAVTVFYGITLGLLAVGTWTTYSDVQGKIDHEASVLGWLYRDLNSYPEPARGTLQADLRRYVRGVIDVGWPLQQRGIVPNNANSVLSDFQKHLMMDLEPKSENQKIVAAEVFRTFGELTESRRARLNSVTDEMPAPLWTLVMLGAFICIATTWFFQTQSFSMHFWMTLLFSALIGLMIYLVAVLDNPYRGTVSVSPEPLERVYQQSMLPPAQ